MPVPAVVLVGEKVLVAAVLSLALVPVGVVGGVLVGVVSVAATAAATAAAIVGMCPVVFVLLLSVASSLLVLVGSAKDTRLEEL